MVSSSREYSTRNIGLCQVSGVCAGVYLCATSTEVGGTYTHIQNSKGGLTNAANGKNNERQKKYYITAISVILALFLN